MKKAPILPAILFALLLLSGCLFQGRVERPADGNLAFGPEKLGSADFAGEIEKLDRIALSPTAASEDKAEAHRRLAILHLMPANPGRDPQKALDELGKFVAAAPHRLDRTEAAAWLAALNREARLREQADENRKLAASAGLADKENRRLTAANRELAAENEELLAANTRLQKTIEKIKNLDLSLEQKRRSFLR